jgi:mannose-6-phosphate isomerase-like protein (cupin superfamily)
VSAGYEILTLDAVETAEHRGSNLIPVRHTLGFSAAGVNAWIADVGGQLIPPHEEDSGNEELYVVVRGRASFVVGDETEDAPAGTLVFVEAGEHRTATAAEDGTIVFCVGATIGEAFRPGGWDAFALAMTLRESGRFAEGAAIVDGLIANEPGHWGVHYNAGCFAALGGDADAAFAHLQRARELDAEAAAPYIREDGDLDNLRADPRFQELLA